LAELLTRAMAVERWWNLFYVYGRQDTTFVFVYLLGRDLLGRGGAGALRSLVSPSMRGRRPNSK
jgi:hypothetical protein